MWDKYIYRHTHTLPISTCRQIISKVLSHKKGIGLKAHTKKIGEANL